MNTTDAIGSIAVWCGGATGVTQLLDWLLAEKAKASIRFCFERLWLWLAEQKTGKLLDALFSRRFLFWPPLILACVSLTLSSFLLAISWPTDTDFATLILNAIVFHFALPMTVSLGFLAAAGYFLLPKIASWLARPRQIVPLLGRLVLCSFSTLALSGLLAWPMTLLMSGEKDALLLWTGVLPLATLLASLLFTILLLVAILWLITVGGLAAILKAGEFIFLRLAEHPKGPVLGASALVAALGLILKSFS